MPGGDGTGPDGNGPKSVNKGWPRRYPQPQRDQGSGRGQGLGRRGQGLGRGLRRRDGSCQIQDQPEK